MGIDIDPETVKAVRSRGLDVRLGTLEAQGFPADYFDAIVMNHVIEHIHDPLEHLRECHRVLKKGGVLSLATPNVASLGHERFRQYWVGLRPTAPSLSFLAAVFGNHDKICRLQHPKPDHHRAEGANVLPREPTLDR